MSIQTNCPSCEASYTLADTQRGKKVRCRKCSNTFVVGEAGGDDAPASAPMRSSKDLRKDGLQSSARTPSNAPPPRSKPAAVRRDRDRDEDDEDEGGRPARKPEVRKKSGSHLPMILMIGGGVLLLLLLGGVAVVVAVVYTASSAATNGFNNVANAVQNGQQPDPNDQGFNPGGGQPVDNPPKDVGEALTWVSGGIQDKKIRAAEWLATAPVDDSVRENVAASLTPLLTTRALHDSALRALSVWAGPENVPVLLTEIPPPGGIGAGGGPAVDALVRLKSPAVIPILARELPNIFEHEKVADRLAQVGNAAEKEVLNYLNSPDANARTDADRLLKGYGTTDAKRFDQSLTDLSDPDKAKQACAVIARTRVDEARRAEVSKSLETPLDSRDGATREAAANALKSWATKDNVPALIRAMDKGEFGFGAPFDACVEALAKLKDERGAEAVAAHLKEGGPRRDVVVAALAEMGPVAEKAVAVYANNPDHGVAEAAEKLLKGYGSGSNVRLAAAIADLSAKDGQTRKAACEFLATQPVDEASHAQVARALDKLLEDADFFLVPDAAAKAEVVWADKDSIPALVKAMDKQFGNLWQPCLEALSHIKDDKAVFAVLNQLPKHPNEVKVALAQMGPLVETALDDALTSPAASVNDKVYACKALFDLGTKTSLPVLQATAMDPNPLVKQTAAATLAAIKKRS